MLSPEQRRALAMLATTGCNGATQTLLTSHGFSVSMIADLVNRGLATMTREQVKAGGNMIEVGKARIIVAFSLASQAQARQSIPLILDQKDRSELQSCRVRSTTNMSGARKLKVPTNTKGFRDVFGDRPHARRCRPALSARPPALLPGVRT